MKIKVTIEVEAPDGATHFVGDLCGDPTWWKLQSFCGSLQWFYFSSVRRQWRVHGGDSPMFLQKVPKS